MDLDCLTANMPISGLIDHEKLANAYANRNNNICKKKKQILPDFRLLCKLEIDTFWDKHSRTIKTFGNF